MVPVGWEKTRKQNGACPTLSIPKTRSDKTPMNQQEIRPMTVDLVQRPPVAVFQVFLALKGLSLNGLYLNGLYRNGLYRNNLQLRSNHGLVLRLILFRLPRRLRNFNLHLRPLKTIQIRELSLRRHIRTPGQEML
jgi:hypothetical protein